MQVINPKLQELINYLNYGVMDKHRVRFNPELSEDTIDDFNGDVTKNVTR